ncbi:hypothetical protein GECvBN6_gp043c [Salmonella phage GEC_vB_N6]|uniref:Uncharacterized protein n=4 Tax=Kuttervirus TaxID=2169536 RepID=A0A6G9L9Z3_9CAUD|nr:hypothetical protein HYQ33_gp137 [Salmonella phage aagejoakim]YP_009888863.1 hypothetical protein HYQ36_gp140 [Salmonella phage moki]QFR58387.1 hypothetical protein AC3HA11_1260 [Escherichia phage vB_EcoM_3HA11]QPI15246.1 hypothetical protein GECvBN6_gp043c [Salmonella phage GEC_vB_N6]WDS51210.1 hypothetical protein SeF3a_127 [Salmonella phage SeF3a]QIO02735.1 hypothetical protein aagejoakim_137 [Salmonella phage aagejoakim]QIQ62413.1 hypothetical protein moki_140 [Salmonella phage moki]
MKDISFYIWSAILFFGILIILFQPFWAEWINNRRMRKYGVDVLQIVDKARKRRSK